MSKWPYNSDKDLIAAGYKFDNRARCRGCGAEIEFWQTPRGKYIPLDSGTLEPHFGTCPNADEFRKNKRGAQ